MKNLASAYEKAGELDRREPLLRELVRLYEAKGDKDQAESWRKKLKQDKTASPQRKQD